MPLMHEHPSKRNQVVFFSVFRLLKNIPLERYRAIYIMSVANGTFKGMEDLLPSLFTLLAGSCSLLVVG